MLQEITIPLNLLLALIDGDTCPLCLGTLRGSEVCPVCHADLGPALDKIEEHERNNQEKKCQQSSPH